jgi:hypothetical protein
LDAVLRDPAVLELGDTRIRFGGPGAIGAAQRVVSIIN